MVDSGFCGLCVLFYLLEMDGDPGAPLSVGCEFCSVLPPSVSCEKPWCTPSVDFGFCFVLPPSVSCGLWCTPLVDFEFCLVLAPNVGCDPGLVYPSAWYNSVG
jgi:hypothetical protein